MNTNDIKNITSVLGIVVCVIAYIIIAKQIGKKDITPPLILITDKKGLKELKKNV